MKNRIVIFSLAICMTLTYLLPMVTVKADAVETRYSGYNYTTVPEIAEKLTKVLNGDVALFSNTDKRFRVGSTLSRGLMWADNWYSGEECFAYANAVYLYLFGDVPHHGNGIYQNSYIALTTLKSSDYDYDPFALYYYFRNAHIGCGAYLRTGSDGSNYTSDGHSLIVLSYNSQKVAWLDANWKYDNVVRLHEGTWEDFKTVLNHGGKHIAHVIQPCITYEIIPTGTYTVLSALNSSMAIDVLGNGTANGTNIQLYARNWTNAQSFRFEHLGYGRYRILHTASGKVLDVLGGSSESGANVQLYDWNGTNAQLWRIYYSPYAGGYTIQNVNGCYLDVSGGNTWNGVNIQVYNGNGTLSQAFFFD